jgi:cell surface hyaluronidase
VLPDGTKTYVQQTTGTQYRSYFMSSLYGTPSDLLDPGFESPIQGSGTSAYQYRPTGSVWSFSGPAGLAGNGSAFTSGNPNAPQASQVAFLQKTGSISQTVGFAANGAYVINLSAAQRGNYGTSNEAFQVLVDGRVVGTITPASTTYANYTTASFSVIAGSHTIAFAGLDPSGADYSAFLDQVRIDNVAPTGFTDPSFENPSLGAGPTAYQYDPTGSAWSFSGHAGLAGNGSGFTAGNPNAPQGSQVVFLQKTGSVSQVVNFAAAGSYVISLGAAQRANNGTSNEAFQVLVDGRVVGTITPSGTSYATYTTALFSVIAGSHTITFAGVDPSGADYSALLDQVSILQVG